MSHLINVMFLDVNESVSRIDDFWLTTNVNSTARTTHENFINNTNNNIVLFIINQHYYDIRYSSAKATSNGTK